MAAIGLDHYNIKASTELINEVRKFYCELVGLIEGYRPPFQSVGYWLYAGERPVLHLSVAKENDLRRTDSDTTIDHVAFNCVDLADMRNRLDSLGIRYRMSEVPARGQIQIFVRDPAGNGVELNFAQE